MMCLTWLGGPMIGPIDIDPGDEIMRELEQPAACHKHRWLVDDPDIAQELDDMTAIDEFQRRIVANGGSVVVGGKH